MEVIQFCHLKMPFSYHPVNPNKVLRLLGPGWQVHVAHHGPVLPHSKMVAVAVDKHLREVVELRNQFLSFKGREAFMFYRSLSGPHLIPQFSIAQQFSKVQEITYVRTEPRKTGKRGSVSR